MIDNEEQKNNSIQGKPNKKASLLLPIIVAAVIFVAMVVSMCINVSDVKLTIVSDDFSMCFQIDSVEIENNTLNIEGWCFDKKKDCQADDIIEVYLRNTVDDTEIIKNSNKVNSIERDAVNEYFSVEYDYTLCGFIASFDYSRLNPEQIYEVIIQYKNNENVAVPTNTFIQNGKLFYYNPSLITQLETEGTDLETIVNSGYLRAENIDNGIYIYQYEDNLFWIADENFNFSEDDWTRIQYACFSTQIQTLEKDKETTQYSVDLSNYFENCEITDVISTGKYRVASTALPDDWPVCSISVGQYYNSGWVWMCNFRPIYLFDKN